MKKKNWKTKHSAPIWTAVVFALILVCVLYGLQNTSGAVNEAGRKSAEEAVRRAAVTCYALEGAYPESYSYLRDRYGVHVNEKYYDVHYSVFASNLMPEITVTERQVSG